MTTSGSWMMIPQVSALDELLQAKMIVGENFGFLASCVIWTNGDFCKMNNPGIMKEALYGQEYRFLENGIINIHHASFVSVLFRADVIKEILQQIGTPAFEMFSCRMLATKAVPTAKEFLQSIEGIMFQEVLWSIK